ncbi:MAG: hypothetical protein ABIO46_03805 [Chitinophagales bacterium]
MATGSIFASVLFILTTILAVSIFYSATANSKRILLIIAGWSILQCLISLTGFYLNPDAIPLRFLFSIAPGLAAVILLFFSERGRSLIDSWDIKKLTLLHIVRLPVEITLFCVFLAGLIPQSMTFEGNNFDILSGITAPIVYCLVFIFKKANWKLLLSWNILCLALLVNILAIAILSAHTPFQQFAFDQPNIGVTYFPFVLLPSVVVPLVLISHLVSIRKILKAKSKKHNGLVALA